MNPYLLIIALAGVVIISFLFNIVSRKTSIPSVLMLIALGVGIKAVMDKTHLHNQDLQLDLILEILGNVGLVMIVLEAALDLKLARKKLGFIMRAFMVALVGLIIGTAGLALFFSYIFPSASTYQVIVYAIPLSIMSSAIVIPSVGKLANSKKEFMIYESTFADILGIMVFYFMVGTDNNSGSGSIALEIILNVTGTVLLSVLVAYGMVYLFQHLKMQVKLFLIIAVLILLFAVGKYFHLSSLLIILAFGVVLNNTEIFFRGRLSTFFDNEKVKPILHDFHNLTLESAFLIRTFFFVVFGMSITLSSLYNLKVAINSIVIVAILFLVRYLTLRFLSRKHVFPELFINPRGLITVLLFFTLLKDDELIIRAFDPGLLLYPILITSAIMTIALILYRGDRVKDVILTKLHLTQEED